MYLGEKTRVKSSFRDPSGFLFLKGNSLYRQINPIYKENYKLFMESGLYAQLVESQLLIPHEEFSQDVIKPKLVPFISYPYEWCFSELKDAALTTLRIQKIALQYGMTLKDASAYNIQFLNGKPILIDTLSFDSYKKGQVWTPYRQFCQHFLCPLALMAYKDVRLSQFMKIYIDGIPLDLTAKLLPSKCLLKPNLLMHIYAHALSQKRIKTPKLNKMSKISLIGLIDNLESLIKRLRWKPKGGWSEYSKVSNYSSSSFKHKIEIVRQYLDRISPKEVWDLGSNIGTFSQIAANIGAKTIAFDLDPACTELSYLNRSGNNPYLPLNLDVTNPTPGIGWANAERLSLLERSPADTALALALVHHLALSNNIPLCEIAEFFSKICKHLIIEFVPKEDSQVRKMLMTKEDIFPEYTQAGFEGELGRYFNTIDKRKINGTLRTIYLMEKK